MLLSERLLTARILFRHVVTSYAVPSSTKSTHSTEHIREGLGNPEISA
jgi:hypothetical protein